MAFWLAPPMGRGLANPSARFTRSHPRAPSLCSTLSANAAQPNGYAPLDSLFQGTDGNFYGTTAYNGYIGTDRFSGYGTVFKLSTGLGPLVKSVPAGGKVGKQVLILGNGLTGTTGVTFNGIQANFTVESDTYIKATVPAGATTGKVSVATPSGSLDSNPQFVVMK